MTYTTKEARLLETLSAWRARADQDAKRMRELEFSLDCLGQEFAALKSENEAFKMTIKAIGERKAGRPSKAPGDVAEGTRG